VLVAAVLVAVGAIGYVWQIVGATGPALPLRLVGDFPLTGSASRFDYASMDPSHGALWLAHMGDGTVEAFHVKADRITLTVPISPNASVRGILVARDNVYAAAQGLGAVVVLDAAGGKRVATIPGADVDAWRTIPLRSASSCRTKAAGERSSSTHVLIVQSAASRWVKRLGNTQYDAESQHIFVGIQTRNELAEIDAAALKLLRRYPLSGCSSSHSVAIDSAARAAYIGCQHNARLVRLDLRTGRVTASGSVGIGIDILAFDPGPDRLYVGSESGVVSGATLRTLGSTASRKHSWPCTRMWSRWTSRRTAFTSRSRASRESPFGGCAHR
jgi:DNA-binding beta-propeller fold protein YncE